MEKRAASFAETSGSPMPRFRRDTPGGGEVLGYILIAVLAFVVLYIALLLVLAYGVYWFLRERGVEEGKAMGAAVVMVVLLSLMLFRGC